MKVPTLVMLAAAALGPNGVIGQSVLFDFDAAAPHSPLPLSLTTDGITAQFSATGQGFSIQPADTMGFTPVGFAGNCIYPSSVFAADLIVGFSPPLTNFSILYAPQELACDSSARMRVTAYLDAATVGTSTMTADPPGTWPSATLAFSSTNAFDRVVVHYDAPPPTGGDYGPIFMADNVTVAASPPTLHLSFIDIHTVVLAWPLANAGWTLECSADLKPGGWSPVTETRNISGNEIQVTASPAAETQFYRLTQP